jgi:dCMP deaminase
MMERPDWDRYYIDIARVVAVRATCIRRKYGAIIVKDHAIVSTGYCGAPRGEPNCIDTQKCKRNEAGALPGERYELCVSVHAEANAILRASRADMEGSTIYIAGIDTQTGKPVDSRPCLMCRRLIKNARMEWVVFHREDLCIQRRGKDLSYLL